MICISDNIIQGVSKKRSRNERVGQAYRNKLFSQYNIGSEMKRAFATGGSFPDSNFNFHQTCSKLALQICKLAARLARQECKLETSLQKRRSHHATNLQQAFHVKLIANVTNTEYEENLGLELAT
ncbi:hypothetical protein AVEN_101093-1 [Araneus ventricosus]|uniref:Uncharacterized protein n=1 Tax=Araneus ventricosus TaxID=182803 RepID=A0A4Y2N0W1_ARAVE|nr:hypothetical protein AVEN_101093-1 [Araneus ventricosus]